MTLEKNIAEELQNDPELAFSTSDDELFKRATKTVRNQQGAKDLVALGMASIWVVFVSIFMKILKPIFKQMAVNSKLKNADTQSANTTNNGNK